MKDKLLFATIGLLVGIVVMQWTMPVGHADIVASPAGNIFAHVSSTLVIGADGRHWNFNLSSRTWELLANIQPVPIPLADVRFFQPNAFVDKDGNLWDHLSEEYWINDGQPPISPVATEQSTWGKIKATFSPKTEKP